MSLSSNAARAPVWPRSAPQESAAPVDATFGRPFWFSYAANALTSTAISLLYRYGDFVGLLGGSELDLGCIVGVGMIGSLLMRLAQGVGIDTYGPRQVWLLSSALFIASCLGHVAVMRIDSAPVYFLRTVMQTAVAGFFGASITYIAGRAPIARMAEVVGTLGTSGFLGMVVGTSLGDWIFLGGEVTRGKVDAMFFSAASLGALGFAFSFLATRGHPAPRRRRQTMVRPVLRKYNPGVLLLVGVAMGFGLGLPGTFLRPFTTELGIAQIAAFFGVYAPTGFITRLATRRLPQRVGIRPMILLGLATLVAGTMSFLLVRQGWHLVLPAVLIGVAHACLFPSVVAGGSGSFPPRYRGLGTTLVLSMFDLGSLVGSPTVGGLLEGARWLGWEAYPTMFLAVSGILSAVGVAYWASGRSAGAGTSMPDAASSADDAADETDAVDAADESEFVAPEAYGSNC
jgi:MFS family permease